MADRLKITIEFSKADVKEMQTYVKLKELTYGGCFIKDVIMGRIPYSVLQEVIKDDEN